MKSVSIDELNPGDVLARTVINDDMVVILSENTLLTKAHITRLGFLNVPFVYIKDEYDLSTNYQSVEAVFNRSNAFTSQYQEVVSKVSSIFSSTGKDNKVPVDTTHTLVKEDLAPMAKQSGAIDYLYELNHVANDVYNHCLRVSILAGVIGKWLMMPRSKINELIMAGFLHDVGKTKFPERLLSRRVESMKGEDFETYLKHTTDGNQILIANRGITASVRMAALQHHECMDGTGFPFGVKGKDIHEYARIIAVADLYDNMTTEREGFVRQTPFSAIAKITELMYTKLDPAICVVILKHIKNAFLGSSVVLNNGLKGTIVRYPHDFAEHPLVRISQDDIIDLNKERTIRIVEYNPK